MDKIRLLQARKQRINDAGKSVRADVASLIDKDSFVELSAFSFSKNDFYGEEAEGEGVVTGFATIGDYPFYIVAQNKEVLSGGVSLANCEKIVKCISQAEKTSTPVIYLLSTLGVQTGEGVTVLEGLAKVISAASRLKGNVLQYLIVNGEVYGQIAALAAVCDFTFFIDKKSALATVSPLVISARSGKNIPAAELGGANCLSKANLCAFTVKSLAEVKQKIESISNLFSTPVADCDDLNKSLPALNTKIDDGALLKIFDKDTALEVGSSYSPEVKCVLGRIGGITVAAVIFACGDGVKLNSLNVRKIKDFAEFAYFFEIPYINFVNTLGIEENIETSNSLVLKEIAEYVNELGCIDSAKISVVYGKAVGLGYTLFASKSMGYDYSYAFATAKIALFDSVQGAEIEFASDKKADKAKLAEKYADENSDPVNAAKGGFIDNIVEPALIKQYLIASLQMLLK